MKLKNILLFAALFISACHPRPEHTDVRLQDGADGFRLDCDITQFTRQECEQEGFRLCGKGDMVMTYDADHNGHAFVQCIKSK